MLSQYLKLQKDIIIVLHALKVHESQCKIGLSSAYTNWLHKKISLQAADAVANIYLPIRSQCPLQSKLL